MLILTLGIKPFDLGLFAAMPAKWARGGRRVAVAGGIHVLPRRSGHHLLGRALMAGMSKSGFSLSPGG